MSKPELGVLSQAAVALEAEVRELESLTRRAERLELSSQKDLVRASEVLQKAAESHLRFVEQLRTLITGIEDARVRQNASAAALSRCTSALDERRNAYESLQQRFVAVGEAASEVNVLIGQGAIAPAEMPDRVKSARERVEKVIEDARALHEDARAAGLVDLEQQADALRQQLSSLAKKLERLAEVPGAGSSNNGSTH